MPDIIQEIFDTGDSIQNNRHPIDVLTYAGTEMGELSQEVLIEYSNLASHKSPGADGIVGEAVDAIICLVDLIRVHDSSITSDEVHTIIMKKLSKWEENAQ